MRICFLVDIFNHGRLSAFLSLRPAAKMIGRQNSTF